MKTLQQKVLDITKIVALALMLVVGVNMIYATNWSAPLATPPNCISGNPGCDAPLNVSGTAQTKTGNLTVNGAVTVGGLLSAPAISTTGGALFGTQIVNGSIPAVYGLLVQNGNVGIGTVTPATKLDVNGVVKATGLQITGGTAPLTGKVLTADVNGNATWGAASATGVSQLLAGLGTTISPTGGTGNVTVNTALTAGSGISLSPTSGTGPITIASTGVTQLVAGTGVTLTPAGGTGAVTINASPSNNGVSSIIAGTGLALTSTGTGGTGDVTINITPSSSPIYTLDADASVNANFSNTTWTTVNLGPGGLNIIPTGTTAVILRGEATVGVAHGNCSSGSASESIVVKRHAYTGTGKVVATTYQWENPCNNYSGTSAVTSSGTTTVPVDSNLNIDYKITTTGTPWDTTTATGSVVAKLSVVGYMK